MDPEVKKYFRKIIYSFSFGMLWLTANVMLGIYFGFAYRNDLHFIFNVLFYFFLASSLFFLLRYYYFTWKKWS